jgi:hypothetical protein
VSDDRRQLRDDDHDRYEVMAAGWALHALEPDDEREFAAHLASCDQCRRDAEELEAAVGDFAYAAPPVVPPEGLLDRLKEAVAADDAQLRDRAGTGPAPSAPIRSDRDSRSPSGRGAGVVLPTVAEASPTGGAVVPLAGRRAFRDRAVWLVAAAAVLAFLALAGWNMSLQREIGQQRQVVAQRDAMLQELVQPGRRMAALGPFDRKGPPVAYVMSRGDQLAVVTSGMDPNTPGSSSFWLWGQWDQRRVPLGRFDVRTGEMELHTVGAIPAGMKDVGAFAVSLEPGTAKPAEPTRIVALGGVDS